MKRIKKALRYTVGTLIFVPFSPIWIFVDWMLEDDHTLWDSIKYAYENWKSMVEPDYRSV